MDSCDSLIDEHHRARADIDRESFRNWREKVLADTFRSSPKPTKNAWIPAEQPVESGNLPQSSLNLSGFSVLLCLALPTSDIFSDLLRFALL